MLAAAPEDDAISYEKGKLAIRLVPRSGRGTIRRTVAAELVNTCFNYFMLYEVLRFIF